MQYKLCSLYKTGSFQILGVDKLDTAIREMDCLGIFKEEDCIYLHIINNELSVLNWPTHINWCTKSKSKLPEEIIDKLPRLSYVSHL